MTRSLTPADVARAVEAVVGSGLFTADEAPMVEDLLKRTAAGLSSHAFAMVHGPGDAVDGVVFVEREPVTNQTWNMKMIAVHAAAQRRGVGRSLVGSVVQHLVRRGGRLLLVETADTASFAGQRAFYAGLGFTDVAVVPDFYENGMGKRTYIRHLH